MDPKTSEWTTPDLGADGDLNLPFAAVMDQAPIEVVISDARGNILFINRRFEAFSGLTRQEAVGLSIEVLKQPPNDAYYETLRRCMETGVPWQGKLECQTTAGDTRIYDTTISPIREKTGNRVVFISIRRDITDLDTRERQLQQAGKMEAIGTLAGGIAHDFNNILAGMVGYAELVKEDLEDLEGVSSKTHARLDNMISGAIRAKKLIQQILTFSRSGRQARHLMGAGSMVKEVVQLLRASLPSTIRIELALETEALVMAEPTQIHQILMNLCTNARDAMGDAGGVLSISLTEVKTGSGRGGVGEWVLLRVADTGTGIARDLRPKVVEPFFTTKPVEKGTGMGLSVVDGIVSALGGRMDIKGNSPCGAVFEIFLPLHRTADQGKARTAEPRPPARGKDECILFVDDESDLVSIAEDGLSSMGYQVVGFDDSGKALDWLKANVHVPDLLIADVTMPGLPGDLLTREMHRLRPDLPVLLITGASDRVDETRLGELGVLSLLHKPMVMDQMAAAIRQALDRGKMADILIIDDEDFIRDVLGSRVNRLGHTAREAPDLSSAFQILTTHPVDLVFLDVNLPDGSGLDALPKIRAAASAPEVIIITAVGTEDGAALAIQNGAWDYITKPFRKDEIVLLIRRSLECRQAQRAMEAPLILNTESIVGSSDAMRRCLAQVARSAANTANVFIEGETGTGKELFARAVHDNCRQTPGNYVVVDCAAMPEALTESVLFGHAKGAFTGAEKASEGLVKGAHQGSLFLDEVGELPLSIQKAFLRVLQERCFRPVGSAAEVRSDFRLISATNRDLDEMVAQGRFREDLLHRLKTFSITLPPLRNRKEDLQALAAHYLEKLCRKHRIPFKAILPETLSVLKAYDWPGNVRELINALEKAILSAPELPLLYPMFLPDRIRISHASRDIASGKGQEGPSGGEAILSMPFEADQIPTLKEYREKGVDRMERVYLTYLLQKTGQDLDQGARIAGISKNRLYFLLRKYRINRG